jgi:hypothetical protein
VSSLIKRGIKELKRVKSEGKQASNEHAIDELTRNDIGTKTNKAAPAYAHELEMEMDNFRIYLSHLVAWWSDTERRLSQMKDILSGNGYSLYRDALIHGLFHQTWTSIKKQHSTYRDQVSLICFQFSIE